MAIYRFCIFLIAVALITGMTESTRRASAVEPARCPQWQCRTIHAHWNTTNGVRAQFLINNGGNTDDFFFDIFTQNSTDKKPEVPTGNQIDEKEYDTCIPTCGKDAAGVWQATQEVSIPQGAMVLITKRINQNRCTPANGPGPKVEPPKNSNDKNLEPPMPKEVE